MQSRNAILLAVATAIVTPIAAQDARLKNALPASTIFFVSAPDLPGTWEKAQEMPLMRMWREAEVQDFFADAIKMGQDWWHSHLDEARQAHEAGQLPFDPDDLMKLRLDGISLALTGLDLKTGEGEPYPHISLLVHADFGASAPGWRKLAEFALQMAESQSRGGLTREDSMIGDVELISLVPTKTEMSLNFAFIDHSVVFGTVKSEVEGVIERMRSGEDVLTSSDNYQSTVKHLDLVSEMECFFQPKPVIDFALYALELAAEHEHELQMVDLDGVRRAIVALGLRGIHAMGATSIYEDNEATGGRMSVTKTTVLAPEQERKGLIASMNSDLDLDFLWWVPKDIASFQATSFDFTHVYDTLVSAMMAYDEDMAQSMLGTLAHYEEQFGATIRDDLLGALGNRIITWSMPMTGQLTATPEMAVLLQVRDQEKLLKSLNTLAQLSDGAFEIGESTRRGLKLYQVQINYNPMGGSGFSPMDMFMPTFAFKNGYMVAGLNSGDVRRAFKRMDREDDPTGDVRGNEEFKAYLDRIPSQGVQSISFSDWKANFEGFYQLITGVIAFVPVDEDIPVDLSLLPDAGTLTQHLFGSVSWSTVDADGIHSHSMGPWGPETMALLGGGVAAGVIGYRMETRDLEIK